MTEAQLADGLDWGDLFRIARVCHRAQCDMATLVNEKAPATAERLGGFDVTVLCACGLGGDRSDEVAKRLSGDNSALRRSIGRLRRFELLVASATPDGETQTRPGMRSWLLPTALGQGMILATHQRVGEMLRAEGILR